MSKNIKIKEIITKDSPKIKVLYEEKDLRIHVISKLIIEDEKFGAVSLPASKGVGIEAKTSGNHFYVIAFVEPDEHGNIKVREIASKPDEEDFYNRVLDYFAKAEGNDKLYYSVLEKAKQIVREANNV